MIDESGQRNFSKALAVTKQIFNSLTEYIQVSNTCSSILYIVRVHKWRVERELYSEDVIMMLSILTLFSLEYLLEQYKL